MLHGKSRRVAVAVTACKMENPLNNLDLKVTGDKLVITIDLTGVGVPSSTGKTKLIASTRGAVAIEYAKRPGVKVAVNVTVPNGH
jgi:hypothetical protein